MTWCNAPGVQPALLASASAGPAPGGNVRSRLLAVGVLALALGACDFPTEPPIFESRFIIPAEQTTLRVGELLPAEVTVVGNEFALSIQPVTFARTLGQMCGAPCVAANGLTIPKPAFSDNFPVTITLPADVQSAVVSSGGVAVTLGHTFGFDPLRPTNGANGSITVTLRSAGTVVGTLTITDPFPSGTQLTRTVPISANATITAPLTVDIALTSPAGTNLVTINSNAALNVTASPAALRISQASVRVPATNVDVEQVQLDLSDIDQEIADRVQSGALVVRTTNPFPVSGTLTLAVTGANVQPKQVTVSACAAATPCLTTQRIEFSEAEMQSMLGNTLTLSITGRLTSASGFVTVRPTQQIDIDTQLDMVLRLGGDED